MKDFPKEFGGMAETPAAEHMLKTRSDAGYLDQETAELFHHVTAQLLFLGQRGRPDIRNAVSFLCKRVKSPENDNYKKIHKVIKYLRRIKFLRLTMEADQLDQSPLFNVGICFFLGILLPDGVSCSRHCMVTLPLCTEMTQHS